MKWVIEIFWTFWEVLDTYLVSDISIRHEFFLLNKKCGIIHLVHTQNFLEI